MAGLCQSGQASILTSWSSSRHVQLITCRSKRSRPCGDVAQQVVDRTSIPRGVCLRCGAAGGTGPSLDQSPDLQEGMQEQKQQTKWATATVTQNRQRATLLSCISVACMMSLLAMCSCRNVSADGCMRSLTLSIEDPVCRVAPFKLQLCCNACKNCDAVYSGQHSYVGENRGTSQR